MSWDRTSAKALLGMMATVDSRYSGLEPADMADTADMWARLLNSDDVDPAFAMTRVEAHYRVETRKLMPGDIVNPWRARERAAAVKQDAFERAVDGRAESITDDEIDSLHFLAGGTPGAPDWFARMAEAQPDNAAKWSEMRDSARPGVERLFGVSPGWFRPYKAACDEAADWPSVRASGGTGKPYQVASRAARARIAAIPVPVSSPVDGPRDQRERACGSKVCACPHSICRDGWMDQGDTIVVRGGVDYAEVERCSVCFEAVEMAGELAPKRGRR